MPTKHGITATFTFSLPPEMAQELRQVGKGDDRTVSEPLREASRLFVLEREWRRRERLRMVQIPADGRGTGMNREEMRMNDMTDYTPVFPTPGYAAIGRTLTCQSRHNCGRSETTLRRTSTSWPETPPPTGPAPTRDGPGTGSAVPPTGVAVAAIETGRRSRGRRASNPQCRTGLRQR